MKAEKLVGDKAEEGGQGKETGRGGEVGGQWLRVFLRMKCAVRAWLYRCTDGRGREGSGEGGERGFDGKEKHGGR